MIPISEDEDKHHPKQRRSLYPIVLMLETVHSDRPSLVPVWVRSLEFCACLEVLLLSCGQGRTYIQHSDLTSCWATLVGGRRKEEEKEAGG